MDILRNGCNSFEMDESGEDASHPFAESVMMGMDGEENGTD